MMYCPSCMSWEMEKVTAITPFMKFLFRCAQESGPLSPEAEKGLYSAASGILCAFFGGGISLFSEDGWTVTDRFPFPIFVILSRLSLHCLSTGWERLHV